MNEQKHDGSEVQEQTTGVAVEENGENKYPCECCTPPENLILRPDLGIADGRPRFAVCIMPETPQVHEWSKEEKKYKLKKDWTIDNDGVKDGKGKPVSVHVLNPEDIMDMSDDEDDEAGGANAVGRQTVQLDRDRYYFSKFRWQFLSRLFLRRCL